MVWFYDLVLTAAFFEYLFVFFAETVHTVQPVRRPTISFSASSVSMSPILAAAHASGGVRASRMAASSCRHKQAAVSSSMLTHRPGLKEKTRSVAEEGQCGEPFEFVFSFFFGASPLCS